MNKIILCLILVSLMLPSLAQKANADEAMNKKKNKPQLIGSPIVFYSPETKLGFGGAGSLVFRLSGTDDKITRASTISPLVIYTLEKQIRLQLGTELYFKNNAYRIKAELKYEKFPFKFYGIGSDTTDDAEELYTPRGLNFYMTAVKNLGKGFNMGFRYHFRTWNIIETEPGRQLDSGLIEGSEKGTISGLSLVLGHDTRDHIFFPTSGDFIEVNIGGYPKFLGSTFKYSRITLDLRKYYRLFNTHVLALQAAAKSFTGTVPFMELPRMGGEFLMRGYYYGRYMDKNFATVQAEYRLPLFWRLGLVGFAGLGNIAPRLGAFDFSETKYSYGFGLRYLFSKKEKIRIRLDIAFGNGSSGFYISALETF